MMKIYLTLILLLFFITHARATMMTSEQLNNNPKKLKLCISRNRLSYEASPKLIPFEINAELVQIERKENPDVIFYAVDGNSPQLYTCKLSKGTGRFEVISGQPTGQYWNVIRPKAFEPGVNTNQGKKIVDTACREKALAKYKPKGEFDHSVYGSIYEIPDSAGLKQLVDGKKAQRYDITAEGTSFFKSANPNSPDLDSITYHCIFGPNLEFKAVQIKKGPMY